MSSVALSFTSQNGHICLPTRSKGSRNRSHLFLTNSAKQRRRQRYNERRRILPKPGVSSRQEGEELDNSGNLKKRGAVLVLFKSDLRVDDHPGLQSATEYSLPVVPWYCIDSELLQPIKRQPGQVELVWGALKCLQTSLRSAGSDLIIKSGNLAVMLSKTVKEIGATVVITETELDVKWRRELKAFGNLMPEIHIQEWQSRLYDTSVYTQNYKDMDRSKRHPPVTVPLPLKPVPDGIGSRNIPDLEGFKKLLSANEENTIAQNGSGVDVFLNQTDGLMRKWSMELTASPEAALKMLREYLCRDRRQRGNASFLSEIVETLDNRRFPGISFAPLFSGALSFGILSPRQILHEIEQSKNSPHLWPWSDPFKEAAKQTSASYDFHGFMADEILRVGCKYAPGSSSKEFWNWKGILGEYSISRPRGSPLETVVLIHGFGASCMHWRRNVDALTDAGYTVYCPSLPGYGRTQKLYTIYSQHIWVAYLSDFIEEIVGESVILGGNSIGAFVAAQTAAKIPELVSALILINPAGPINPDYTPSPTPVPVVENPPPAFVINICAELLLLYLIKSAGRILRRVYPVRTENADDTFLQELRRAAYDPNAIAVLKSVFFLKKPIPLNILLSEMFRKPVLLLQGAQDPLNDARRKGNRLNDLCPNIQMEMLEAGHCSHDEVPEIVNDHLIQFLATLQARPIQTPSLRLA